MPDLQKPENDYAPCMILYLRTYAIFSLPLCPAIWKRGRRAKGVAEREVWRQDEKGREGEKRACACNPCKGRSAVL